ncbi:Uncharacterised protein [Actinobacillus equuli]|nr:Uncharacterised protein [Actinobacillus equuli]
MKDNFQAWYLLHFEYYLAYLMQLISALQPTKIITAGCSAGGYAAILFGHYLFADQTFAFSPQTKVFDKIHMSAYREVLNERYQLAQFELTDLALLQQKQHGFRNQLHLFLSSGNREDLVEFDRLDWQNTKKSALRFTLVLPTIFFQLKINRSCLISSKQCYKIFSFNQKLNEKFIAKHYRYEYFLAFPNAQKQLLTPFLHPPVFVIVLAYNLDLY